jgi:hypothetical protein
MNLHYKISPEIGLSNDQGLEIRCFTANVGTEGATKKFLIWTHFGIRDRFPNISLISHRITMFYRSFFQNNYGAISDRAGFAT